jgi:hypothetical protein
LTAPIVNEPPNSRDWAEESSTKLNTIIKCMNVTQGKRNYRVSWKAIKGWSQLPLCARVCQKGVAPDEAICCHARPSKPDTGLESSPVEMVSHTPIFKRHSPILTSWRNTHRKPDQPQRIQPFVLYLFQENQQLCHYHR